MASDPFNMGDYHFTEKDEIQIPDMTHAQKNRPSTNADTSGFALGELQELSLA
jgi:hypothetical protein